MPPISNALRCPQHSSQVSLRKRSKVASVVPAVMSRCIQYSGRWRPSTTRWNVLIFCASRRLHAFASVLALCSHVSRCLVIADLLNSPLQKVHVPFDVCLAIYFLLSWLLILCELHSHSIRYGRQEEKHGSNHAQHPHDPEYSSLPPYGRSRTPSTPHPPACPVLLAAR